MQSKDSFESVGSSAGTPDADVMHHSDLSNIKLKTDAEGKRSQRKGNSAGASPAARNNHHHYQNAEQQMRHDGGAAGELKHKGSTVGVSPAKQHKRKGPSQALPPTPQSGGRNKGDEEDIMGPEHEYEDIPGQSDDEEEDAVKEDRWNDTGVEDKDELDEDERLQRRLRRRTQDDEEEDSFGGTATTNSNDTRTLTQQCSLVAPNEVHITESPALVAEPVLSESGA